MLYTGVVSRVVWSKPEDSFYIMKIHLDVDTDSNPFVSAIEDADVTVKGTVPGMAIKAGSWFGFEGKWVNDSRYGRQLHITKAPIFPSKITTQAVVSLLSDHVDRMVLWRLRDTFPNNLSDALEDIDTLRKALNISEFEAEFLSTKWRDVKARFRAYNIVSELNLSKSISTEIWATFGQDTERVLTEEPYSLVEVPGISIQMMDELASRFGISRDCPERKRAVVLFAVREHMPPGDLYMDTPTFIDRVMSVDTLSPAEITEALRTVLDSGSLILDKTTVEGTKAIYLPWAYSAEEFAASNLVSRVRKQVEKADWLSLCSVGGKTTSVYEDDEKTVDDLIYAAVDECAESLGFELSEGQREAMYHALRYRVSVTTGLPGTGKSTSMRVLVEILRRSHTSMLLMAPTGIAAKRLGYVTNQPAYTIHRALGAMGVSADDGREAVYAGVVGSSKGKTMSLYGPQSSWEYHEGNPHPARFVIVDESSMIDQDLVTRLLTGCHPDAHVVFVGDAAQLPSVGPGNVLRSIISSGVIPVTRLTQIFRQEDTSDIVTAAHAIYRGEVPQTSRQSDFALVDRAAKGDVVDVVLKLVERFYNRSSNWQDSRRPPTFQVLSPRHSSDVGVTNLNRNIRDLVNPERSGVSEMKLKTGVIRTGDRVMITSNDYQKEVYNGDIGKVLSIDFATKRVRVKIHGDARIVDFTTGEAMRTLRLAYACTVHKYQGLEVDTVIMPIMNGFGKQLQRNLLYTAITRAKKQVILVGTRSALEKAVLNDKEDTRKTLFSYRIAKLHAEWEDERNGSEEVGDETTTEEDPGSDASVGD